MPGLSASALREELERLGHSPAREVVFHDRIDSTSSDLKRRLEAGSKPGTAVLADFQHAGRGRQGRTWYSPQGGNLYLSLAVETGGPIRDTLPLLPLASGIAACDALRHSGCPDPRLKWPNDVLVEGRKLAGILCELPDLSSAGEIVIVGLGINVAQSSFPGELADTATSLALVMDEPPALATLAASWIGELEARARRIRAGDKEEIIGEWRERAEPFGRRVRVGDVEGTTVDLAPDGRLIIERDSGERVTVVGGIVEQLSG